MNLAIQDSDGIPPGMDLSLIGKAGTITFSGKFYADPEKKETTITRLVSIVFASPEVYVAVDLEHKNIYVIDRAKNLSLGCRMNAIFREAFIAQVGKEVKQEIIYKLPDGSYVTPTGEAFKEDGQTTIVPMAQYNGFLSLWLNS